VAQRSTPRRRRDGGRTLDCCPRDRVYWSAVASLNNEPDELVDEAVAHLSDATVVCPEILARLADDFIAPVQGSGCADAQTASV
jgi:hypothetical protein